MYSNNAGTGVGGEGTSRGAPEHFSREFELRKSRMNHNVIMEPSKPLFSMTRYCCAGAVKCPGVCVDGRRVA